jgi:competence protein ComEC
VILSENPPTSLQSDILKIGHYGSKNSATPDFLDAIRPRLAVISAGEENPYRHPSPALLDCLQQAEVLILRTDQNGAIHLATDGKRFDVSCFVACPQIGDQANSGRPEMPLQEEDQQQH